MPESASSGKHLPPSEILIFTSTTTEKEKLEEAAKDLGFLYEKVPSEAFSVRNLGEIKGDRVLAIHTEIGAFGTNGSASNAILAKSQTGANTIVAVGMAFGIDPREQHIGDVLVSTSLLTYDDRVIRRNDDGGMFTEYPPQPRVHFPASSVILAKLEQEAKRRDFVGVKLGSLLTGGAAIQCAAFRDNLVCHLSRVLRARTSSPDETIVGGEMEGIGYLSASEREAPNWVLVKGISDFADEARAVASKEEVSKNRKLACEKAARFFLTALRDFEPEIPDSN